VKDVAEIYNVHLLTVYDWVRKGVLNAHHKNGKSMVFAKFDVVNLKRARGKR
jgi:excisionase family DNA binding protein